MKCNFLFALYYYELIVQTKCNTLCLNISAILISKCKFSKCFLCILLRREKLVACDTGSHVDTLITHIQLAYAYAYSTVLCPQSSEILNFRKTSELLHASQATSYLVFCILQKENVM